MPKFYHYSIFYTIPFLKTHNIVNLMLSFLPMQSSTLLLQSTPSHPGRQGHMKLFQISTHSAFTGQGLERQTSSEVQPSATLVLLAVTPGSWAAMERYWTAWLLKVTFRTQPEKKISLSPPNIRKKYVT